MLIVRDKGNRKLVKAYKQGDLSKEHIDKHGYNKFLAVDGQVNVAINYDKIAEDACWDALKGYITNMQIFVEKIYNACCNLWLVERIF